MHGLIKRTFISNEQKKKTMKILSLGAILTQTPAMLHAHVTFTGGADKPGHTFYFVTAGSTKFSGLIFRVY